EGDHRRGRGRGRYQGLRGIRDDECRGGERGARVWVCRGTARFDHSSRAHRARWMDSTVGRFSGEDPNPFGGMEERPISNHRYAYADVDPVDRADATGWATWFQGIIVH